MKGFRRGGILRFCLGLMLWALCLCFSVSALAYATLEYGSGGESVVTLQKALNSLGFSCGSADGSFGRATEAAVRQFQRQYGLTVDGKAGNQTQTKLFQLADGQNTATDGGSKTDTSDKKTTTTATGSFGGNYATISQGSRGDRVRILQTLLNSLGFSCGSADGSFGNATHKAVVAFQKSQGLTQDGKAGRATLTRLETQAKAGSQSNSTPAPAPESNSTATTDDYAIPTRTLRKGYQGEDVKSVQRRLKDLGYYTGSIDGSYGTAMVAAVKAFQQNHGLSVDGNAGTKTYSVLYSASAKKAAAAQGTEDTANRSLRKGDTGEDVKTLQKRLKELGYYKNSVDGDFGGGTLSAVMAFQTTNGLTADGVVGDTTWQKLLSSSALPPAAGTQDNREDDFTPPSPSAIKLLHWFNDIKPTVKSGQKVLVYDPASGEHWTLRFLSLGRHADSEPLTQADTDAMYRAFGNQNTWNQRAVYVRLPSGTWTLASTHNMPHLSGNIKDNGFDGHLCVHFLRDMEEAEKNDPSYGVANQKTIRNYWKKLTGEVVN